MGDIFNSSHTHPTAEITKGWAGEIMKGPECGLCYKYFLHLGSRNSSVILVTRLGTGCPRNAVRFPARVRDISYSTTSKPTVCPPTPPPASCSMDFGGYFPLPVKELMCKAEYLSASTAEVKYKWSYAATPSVPL